MKYTITLYNNWKRPYFYCSTANDNICTNIESSTYITDNIELAKTIIKDFLDVPESELTLDEVKRLFEDHRYSKLSEEKLISIQNYYNGRLSMYCNIINTFSTLNENEEYYERFDIPYKYNHFTVEDDIELEKLLDAYIELKVEK